MGDAARAVEVHAGHAGQRPEVRLQVGVLGTVVGVPDIHLDHRLDHGCRG
jgi:hypothetical protein